MINKRKKLDTILFYFKIILIGITCNSAFFKAASTADALCTKVKYPAWAKTDVNPAIYATVSNSRSPAEATKHPIVIVMIDNTVD